MKRIRSYESEIEFPHARVVSPDTSLVVPPTPDAPQLAKVKR